MIKRLLTFCAATVVSLCSVFAAPEKPVPAFSPMAADGTTIQYLYNVEAKAFFMSANDWSTRASLDETFGFEFKIEANGDNQYILHDNVQARYGNNGERKLGWKVVFAESPTSIYVDRGSQPNWDNWTITDLGDGTYTIGNKAVNGLLGINVSQNINDDSRLYFVEEGATTWAFVSEDDYQKFLEDAAEYIAYKQEEIAREKIKAAREKINAMVNELNSTNVYSQEAYDAFLKKYPINEWLAAGDDIDIAAVEKCYAGNFAVTGWRAANDIDDLLTSLWDGADGNFGGKYYINTWSTEGNNDGSEFKVPFFEYWTGDSNSLGANTMTATVTGLEPGAEYSVSSWTRTRIKNGAEAPVYGITFKVGDGEAVNACIGEQVGTSQMYLATVTATGKADAEGNLTISYIVDADNNISWLSWKNVYYSVNEAPSMEITLPVSITAGIPYEGGNTIDIPEETVAAVCEYLGVESLDKAQSWIVNATTNELVKNTTDGWRNANSDAAGWGTSAGMVCCKFNPGAAQFWDIMAIDTTNKPDDTFTAMWALTANDKTVIFNIDIKFVAPATVNAEIIKTVTVAHYEKPNTAYSANTAKFDVTEITSALGVASIAECDVYLIDAEGELVKNTTDWWRDVNGTPAGWGTSEGMVCVKINNPASGTFDYIGCIDTTHNLGETYVARFAFVKGEKAVELDLEIFFGTEEEATAINGIAVSENAAIFNLNGQKLSAPVKGINIVNGKKVLVK